MRLLGWDDCAFPWYWAGNLYNGCLLKFTRGELWSHLININLNLHSNIMLIERIPNQQKHLLHVFFRCSLRVNAGNCLGLKNARTMEKCYVGQLRARWLVQEKIKSKIQRRYLEQGECSCEDGWGRLPGSSKCSQQSTQASCPEGQIVREAGSFWDSVPFISISIYVCSLKFIVINYCKLSSTKVSEVQIHRYSSSLHKTGYPRGNERDWKWEISAGEGETQILVANNMKPYLGWDTEADPLWAVRVGRMLQNPSRCTLQSS